MTTRADQFKAELFALLRKYDVEMSAEVEVSSNVDFFSSIRFFSYAKWDWDTNQQTHEAIDFELRYTVTGKE